MEHGRKGSRTTIGRIFRPSSSRSSAGTMRSSSLSSGQPDDEYFLAIVGGVDMGLMVLICIALEQAEDDEW